MPARRPNSWFSSTKTKASSGHRSSMTLGEAMSAARKAGHASGDTGAFDSWARSKGLSSRSSTVVSRLRQEYSRGFEQKFSDAAKRDQQKAAERQRSEDAKRKADRRRADQLNAAHVRKLQKQEDDLRKKREAAEKHARSVTSRFGSYKGYGIFKTGDGAYHYSGERESAFDSLKDVKRFVDSLKRNPKKNAADVIDQAAATGMEIYQGIFAIPSAVLDKTIATSLQGKDALKRRFNPGWYDQESDDDARNTLMYAAQSSRSAEELARIHKWATGKRDTELKAAVEARASQMRIPMSQIKGSYPRGWNPQVTDRALRYRANATIEGEERCGYCGTTSGLIEVEHINGHEEDNNQENLMWACRPCNVLKANALREAGIGRLTKQYNPRGATTVGEWVQAVGAITPHKGAEYAGSNYGLASTMPVGEAVAIIRATSKAKRQEFARQLGKHRASRSRLNPKYGKEVKILGRTVREGTKLHAKLMQDVRHFDDLRRSETGRGRSDTKRNPEHAAAHFFKKFHGRDSEEELIVETEIHEHEWLGVLGVLCAVVVDTPTGYRADIHFDEKDAPWLCSSEDGSQLFIEGGCQEIDLSKFGMDADNWTKERMVLGQFSLPEGKRRWNLSYITEKDFDKFAVTEYQHDLGEPNESEPKSHRRESPILEYDAVNKLLYIVGGQYKIDLPLFETSPGIEN